MLSPKNALGIFFYVNIISWLLLLITNLIAFIGYENYPVFSINFYLKGLLLNFFFLIIYFYFRSRVDENTKQTPDFIGLLTTLFITGLVTNTFSLIIQFVSTTLESYPPSVTKSNWLNMLYHLNIGLVSIFLIQAFFHWETLILYQKSNKLSKLWNSFEYLLLTSLLFNFFDLPPSNPLFAISLTILLVLALMLSANLRWVAYLNAKEKWQGILLLLFVAGFTFFFFRTVIVHSYNPALTTDLTHSVFILAIGAFVGFYSVFSILVIIFNLPTSSVFERKTEDIINFQKLAQSLQAGEDEDEVYDVLLNSAMNTVQADAAFLEILDEQGKTLKIVSKNLSEELVSFIKQVQKKQRFNKLLNQTFARTPRHSKNNIEEKLENAGFSSIHVAKLIGHDSPLGSLTVLKEIKSSFDAEKKELLNTFALQASVSIENFRLIAKTIETERYKEEAKIARNVQQQLLPKNLDVHSELEIAAFSQSAYEVGGDYYDLYQASENKIIFIVGDVSGKGSNAAFNMAQMKGIFQGIARMNLEATEFLNQVNQALAACLTPKSFITATLMYIDVEKKRIELSRAGHCPTYHYDKKNNELKTLEGRGIGLGIINNQDYSKYIEIKSFQYQKDDLVVLYTDGIIEARNSIGKEYGYERLKNLITKHHQNSPEEITQYILEDLQNYSKNSQSIVDDYTALVIKFK